jgi:hypothetical protein
MQTTPNGSILVNEPVYERGIIVNGFKPRISFVVTGDENNLLVQNTAESDGGTYQCIEDDGFGSKHTVHLRISGISGRPMHF